MNRLLFTRMISAPEKAFLKFSFILHGSNDDFFMNKDLTRKDIQIQHQVPGIVLTFLI